MGVGAEREAVPRVVRQRVVPEHAPARVRRTDPHPVVLGRCVVGDEGTGCVDHLDPIAGVPRGRVAEDLGVDSIIRGDARVGVRERRVSDDLGPLCQAHDGYAVERVRDLAVADGHVVVVIDQDALLLGEGGHGIEVA